MVRLPGALGAAGTAPGGVNALSTVREVSGPSAAPCGPSCHGWGGGFTESRCGGSTAGGDGLGYFARHRSTSRTWTVVQPINCDAKEFIRVVCANVRSGPQPHGILETGDDEERL